MNFDKTSKYIKKDLDYGIKGLMPADVILVRSVKQNFFMALLGFLIRKITKSWSTHAVLYFGSGKHETIEALFPKVKKTRFESLMNPKTQLRIYRNTKLTVSQLALLKTYAYGCVGRDYSIADLFGFVKKKDDKKHEKNKNFCSELVVESYNCANIKTSKKPAHKTAPGDLRKYFESKAGKRRGWSFHDSRNV